MEDFPDKVECPCGKEAIRQTNPPILGNEDRGPWYGCTSCARLAQYADFIEAKKPKLVKDEVMKIMKETNGNPEEREHRLADLANKR